MNISIEYKIFKIIDYWFQSNVTEHILFTTEMSNIVNNKQYEIFYIYIPSYKDSVEICANTYINKIFTGSYCYSELDIVSNKQLFYKQKIDFNKIIEIFNAENIKYIKRWNVK